MPARPVRVRRKDGFERNVVWSENVPVVRVPDTMLNATFGPEDFDLLDLPVGFEVEAVETGFATNQEGMEMLQFRLRKVGHVKN